MRELIKTKSVWEKLKSTKKPILLYGMGNGADMIIKVLDSFGISWQDTFASDGFVRGHSFHGKRVLSFSEAKERYGDFVIVMTFAVHDEKTMTFVKELSQRYELYSPTVSVVDGSPFTLDFYKENEDSFLKAYDLLYDEKSKEAFFNVLKYKISGDTKYLFASHSEKMNVYDEILHLSDNEVIADLGAYDGDTIREFTLATNGKYKKLIALEPDSKNFRKLSEKTKDMPSIERYNIGAWDKKETILFAKKGGRNSRCETGGVPVEFDSVDSLIKDDITLLKMDIEGAELKALVGATKTIKRCRPKLYVCAYHRNEDMFSLTLKIKELCDDYRIYFRQHPYLPAWESNLYGVID